MDSQANHPKRKTDRRAHAERIASEDPFAGYVKQLFRNGFDNVRWDSDKKNQNK